MMRFLVRRAHARPGEREEGVALVMVVGAMLVLSMLALTALAFAMQSKGFARYAQDHLGALAAADAGVQDYIARLNRNDVYDQTLDCTNVALAGPLAVGGPYPSGTCGYTSTTAVGWVPVASGATGPMAAVFHYRLVSRNTAEQTLTIQSTGRVNGDYRTVEAVVSKGGSTDYVYYTDFESADPSNVQAYGTGGTSRVQCGANGASNASYFYEGRSGCVEIQFIAGDHLNGPVFSNDAVLSSGGHFEDGFESANPGCATVTSNTNTWNNCLRNPNGYSWSSTADFNGIQPKAHDPLNLQDTSGAFASYPGCHYFGSTRIVFSGDGNMKVWNPSSVNGGKAPVAITVAGQPTPNCGSYPSLNTGQVVPVPTNMVVYVAAAPASVTRRECYSGQLDSTSGRTWPVGTLSATQAAAGSGRSYTADANMAEVTKYCAEGNLYVEGTVKGRVTLASEQSIIATGDLVLAGGHGGQDLLGLVATNSVEVANPRLQTYVGTYASADCGPYSNGRYWQYCPSGSTSTVGGWPARYKDPTTNSYSPSSGIQITGSIQTLQHSFLVQKYNEGTSYSLSNLPQLMIYGSIAQRWRGIVGQGSTDWWGNTSYTGYAKTYSYDRRLLLSSPPYFPRWVNSQWLLRYSGELSTPGELRS